MINLATCATDAAAPRATVRGERLAVRLESGVDALAHLAERLTHAQWQTRVPGDARKIGVIIHHVASVLPLEIKLAQSLAAGERIEGVTPAVINAMNATHATEHDRVTRDETLALLRFNAAAAAAAIRALTDQQLDNAAAVSLYSDAPLTCQFMLEDHAVRHSYHHFARIRAALNE